MWGGGNLTDFEGYRDLLRRYGKNFFTQIYGADLRHHFRPFTTDPDATGYARYVPVILPTGLAGATAGGLNPYGPYTLQEGVISGTGIGPNLGNQMVPSSVRTYGFRGPMHVVGWGYDMFGHPAPNYASGWGMASGAFGSVAPSSGFLGTGFLPTYHGANVSPAHYRAGPVDLRWNQHLGVWTSPQSVYAAHVLSTQIGAVTTDVPTGHYVATGIKYNVQLFDGLANQMLLTGVMHIGSRPTGYLVNPLSSGNFCFVVHTHSTGNIPRFGVWAYETPASEECESTESVSMYAGPDDGPPWESSGILAGNLFFAGMAANPLPLEYGGLGVSSIGENEILVGDASGNLVKKTLVASSGISVTVSSGSISLDIADGVDFSVSGVNTTITELQGLVVPLGISQGGTGSSTQIFVDVTTTQTVSGTKLFRNSSYFPPGTPNSVSIGCYDGVGYHNAGLFFNTGDLSVNVAVLGSGVAKFTATGVVLNRSTVIENNTDPAVSGASFVVRDTPFGSGYNLTEYYNSTGGLLGYRTGIGANYSRSLRNIPSSDLVPILIEQIGTGINPLEIYQSGVRKFSINDAKDTIYLDENVPGATGGYIRMTAVSGNSVGFIDLSPSGGFNGGYIRTSAGGSIDTQAGFIEFGPSGFRSIIEVPVTAGNRRYTFSSTTGVIATQQYVTNQIDAIQITSKQITPFIRAFNGTPPTTSFAEFDTMIGASSPPEVFPVVAFDADVNEYMDYSLSMPSTFTGTGVHVNIHYSTSGTTGTGVMGVAFRRLNDNSEDLDTTVHSYQYQYGTCPALSTYGYKNRVSIPVTSGFGLDQTGADEMFVLRLYRFATSGLDTLSGDLLFHGMDLTQG